MSSSSGVLNMVIHGVLRIVNMTGQTYPTPTVSAPILIGPKGGIIVEGIATNVTAGSIVVTDTVVGLVSVEIMAANQNRNSNVIQNNSSNDIWLGFDTHAVANTGIRVYKNSMWEIPIVVQGSIEAIALAGANTITVMET